MGTIITYHIDVQKLLFSGIFSTYDGLQPVGHLLGAELHKNYKKAL